MPVEVLDADAKGKREGLMVRPCLKPTLALITVKKRARAY